MEDVEGSLVIGGGEGRDEGRRGLGRKGRD